MKKTTLTLVIGLSLIAAKTYAYQTGDWILRAGLTNVTPQESSSNVFVNNADLGVGVNVDGNTQLGINVGYFLTPNWSIELLAATPFSHDIGLNTVGALGKTKHLPPTLTANYYFADPAAALQPYVGLGVNYTVFFDEQFTDANTAAGFSDLSLDSSWGYSAQVGIDYVVDSNWHVNASVRYIDISTQGTFKLNGASGKVDVDIDPYVYTLSMGYRF